MQAAAEDLREPLSMHGGSTARRGRRLGCGLHELGRKHRLILLLSLRIELLHLPLELLELHLLQLVESGQ